MRHRPCWPAPRTAARRRACRASGSPGCRPCRASCSRGCRPCRSASGGWPPRSPGTSPQARGVGASRLQADVVERGADLRRRRAGFAPFGTRRTRCRRSRRTRGTRTPPRTRPAAGSADPGPPRPPGSRPARYPDTDRSSRVIESRIENGCVPSRPRGTIRLPSLALVAPEADRAPGSECRGAGGPGGCADECPAVELACHVCRFLPCSWNRGAPRRRRPRVVYGVTPGR